MPYTDPDKQRAAKRESARRRRKAVKAERTGKPVEFVQVPLVDPPWPDDPAEALAEWSASRLVVPPGHAKAGAPMELPTFAVDWLARALAPGIREAGLFVARKNGKSAVVAVLLLACLTGDGPLRRAGFRCGVASLNREKSGELWTQCADIAAASGIEDVRFMKVPKRMVSWWGSVEFLSADKSAGHAAGYDIALIDELGLFDEKGRALAAGMLSSTSARDGRLLAISILGNSPLTAELVQRRDDPSVVAHVYAAPAGCALDDEAAWRAANPGLGTIKSAAYMGDMARRAAALPSEQSNFRSYDLNQPGAPGVDAVVALDQWEAVERQPKPERSGLCFVGFDIGGSVSLTAAAAFWPATGRLDTWGGCGDLPTLVARGESDAVAGRYMRMQERGELRTWPGRVTPVGEFLAWVVEELAGEEVATAAADRYRAAEAQDALDAAGVNWPMEWRAQGSGPSGSEDIRHFQRAVEGGTLRPGECLLLKSAISESMLRYDPNGNPALHKGRQRGRIDALSAAVLAVGLGSRRQTAGASWTFHEDELDDIETGEFQNQNEGVFVL